ncbi:stress-associated endoplasmic reticulum protein 2 isoform X2 [Nothobranchius furzeri]|uniref:stress-associated endoplasmic reticulum protein 2 isoform X2 n=1 Tax=Nothobranchius furzeri TaxID=105023 RepID=UPI0024047752|nr:stress-associated endoplasmic reticulum protein 2 isoform X3 [Nothobranchius furzeri]
MTLARMGDVQPAAARGEVPCGSLVARPVCICCVWISHISDHPEHPYGDVTQREALEPRPHALAEPVGPRLHTQPPPLLQRRMPD